MIRIASFLPVAFFCSLMLAGIPCLAAEAYPAPFPNGVSALFAGHSFFAPVADDFNTIAIENGYTDHKADVVRSGSQSGSPRLLWQNEEKRNEIIGHLDDQDIDLFGLTAYDETNSTFEDYARWFNEALEHNPNTQFFIGRTQATEGAITPSEEFEQITEEIGEQTFQIVKQLRAAYPNNAVHYIHYGKVTTEMKFRYDDGELPDILGLLPDEEIMTSLSQTMFTDISPGHGGPMIKELGALSWMDLLYGADIGSLVYTDYESDVEGIIAEAVTFNEQFQAILVGDYNADGQVDADDFTVWQDAFGQEGLGLVADGNGDGKVDSADYTVWRDNFGASISTGALSTAVPEPSCLVMVTAFAALNFIRRP